MEDARIAHYLIFFMIIIMSILSTQASVDCSSQCPGLYCGRTLPTNDNSTSCGLCGACPRGFRSNSFFCNKCDLVLKLYDWLFLGFIMICVMVLNFYAIDMFHSTNRKSWFYHLSVIIESFLSFVFMILSFEPKGKLTLKMCGVKSIKDWYTVFYNPKPNYVTAIRCTQEAVYPLYTAIFLYLLYCLVLMVLFRGIILPLLTRKRHLKSFYAGLYILPIVGALHTCLAGVVYYIFPYLMIFLSIIGVAVFLSTLNQVNYYQNLRTPRHIGVLACYCVAHGYGIVSITELAVPGRDGPLLLLVFLPVIFYSVSRKFTNAERFTRNF